MNVDTAVPPRKVSNEYLNLFRDLVKLFPMKMPEGMRFTALVLADLSHAVKKDSAEHEDARRIVRATPAEIGRRTDASVRTVGRRLAWLAANGFISVVKAPAPGNGARGVWLLEYPDPSKLDHFIETQERQAERERLASIPKDPGGTAVTDGGTAVTDGGTAVTNRRTRRIDTAVPPRVAADAPQPSRVPTPVTPVAPAPAPPAVPPSGRRPVPGSSGPRPGLPALVADDLLGEPLRVDEGDQPQDAGAHDERTWGERMADLIRDEFHAPDPVWDEAVPAPRGGVSVV